MAAGQAEQTPERTESIARGLALVREGYTYRNAAARVGLPHVTLYDAARRVETFEEDPNRVERIAAKALSYCEQNLERMGAELHDVAQDQLPKWLLAFARLGGLLQDREQQHGSTDLSALLTALAGGGTVEAALRVSTHAPGNVILPGASPAAATVTVKPDSSDSGSDTPA